MQPQLNQLDAEAANLLTFIRASEDWEPGYRSDAQTFEKLIKLEYRLSRAARAYFRGLAGRVHLLAKWDTYGQLKADYGDPEVIVELTDARWDAEGRYILDEMLDDFVAVEVLGVAAGELTYRFPAGVAETNATIIQDARLRAGELIKQNLNPTTQKLLRQSIANSIAKGHSQKEAVAALKEVTRNTGLIRAELIAQTEVVNSFGRGNFVYAKQAGAIAKLWKTSLKPCKVCGPIPLQGSIPIDQFFIGGNGKKFMHQGAHPRCRCRVVYVFPEI